jgi:hypothetical protein
VAGGQKLGVQTLAPGPQDVPYRLPGGALWAINPRLTLTSTTFQPPNDPRRLGTVFFSVTTANQGPALPAPWPGAGLLLSGLLAYAVARLLTRQARVGLLVALGWGLALGAANALARPWLVFHAWYWVVPPLIVLLLLPWLRGAMARRAGNLTPQPPSPEGKGESASHPHAGEGLGERAEPTLTDRPGPLAGAVTLAALAVLAWQYIAPLIPSGIGFEDNWTWSAAWAGALPWPLLAAGPLVVGAALVWAWTGRLRIADRGSRSDEDSKEVSLHNVKPVAITSTTNTQHVTRNTGRLQSAIRDPQSAIVPALILFSLFPSKLSEGDSTEFGRRISRGDLWRERELLDWYLKARIWRTLQAWLPDPAQVYAIVDTLAGGLYVAAAGLLGRTLGRTPREAWTILGGLLAVGNVLLFFGYVESYSLLAAGSLFVIWACWRYRAGTGSFGLVGFIATLTALLHGSALWWGFMVLAAFAGRVRALPPAQRLRVALIEGAEGVGAGLALVLGMISVMLLEGYDQAALQLGLSRLGGGDGHTMMQLTQIETRFEHFTFFTWAHLGEVVQEQLLTAPLALITILLTLALAGRGVLRLARAVPSFGVLAVGAAAVLFYSVTWNADLGARSDWDLLSLPAIPLTLIAVYLLLHLPPGRARRVALAAYLSVSAFHAAAWVALHALNLPFPVSPLK